MFILKSFLILIINTDQEWKRQICHSRKRTSRTSGGYYEFLPQEIEINYSFLFFQNEKLPPECEKYEVLNDKKRNASYKGGREQDGASHHVSLDWKGKKWYRFEPPAGTVLATKRPGGIGYCGAFGPGYAPDPTMPTRLGQITKARVCFSTNVNPCFKSTVIQIMNCGNYYLYELVNVPIFSAKYCAV